VLLSTLLSGVVIAALASVAWIYMVSAFEERVDLEMRDRFGRMFRDLHPRVDSERYREHIETAVRGEVRNGQLLLRIRDDINDQTVYEAPESDWLSQLPQDLLPPPPDGGSRPEFAHGEPPRGGKEKGGPEDFDREARPPPDRFVPDRRKGPKGDGPQEQGRESVRYGNLSFQGKEWRVMVNHGRGYSLIAAMDSSSMKADIAALRSRFFISVPIALGLIALGGWVVAGRALQPIRAISESASQVTAEGLSSRISESPHSDPEIGELIDVLNQMMNRLEKSFEHANRFSANVSHELKTPLAIMQGVVEGALKEADVDSREHENLLVVRQEVQRLKEITNSLLLLAKADVGKLIQHIQKVNLSREVEGLIEDAEILAVPLNLSIETEIEEAVEIEGDQVLLRQALLNLISNAIKYNVEGGSVRIALNKPEKQGQVLFTIENTGPEIPEDDRDKIFSRFHRVDKSRSRKVDGFGLGLSLAHEIVKGHKGKIRLALKSDQMTRFEVSLPLSQG